MNAKLLFTQVDETEFDYIFSLIQKARINSEKQKVYQWDDTYPTKELVMKDIVNGDTYLVYRDGKKVGFFVINEVCEHNDPTRIKWLNDGKFIFLHRFCIDPDYQQAGLGSEVLAKIESDAQQNGAKSVKLDVFSTNAHAIYIYEKSGYKKMGEDLCNRGTFYIYEKLLPNFKF